MWFSDVFLSRQEKSVASVLCSKSKEMHFSLKLSMRFRKIEVVFEKGVNRAHCLSLFFKFEIHLINLQIDMTLQTMGKTVHFLRTV